MDKDKFVRQYDYKANSNLVLPTDTSLLDKRPSHEDGGEIQSLAGRISGRMGDRISSKKETKLAKLEKVDESKEGKRKKKEPSKLKQELNELKGLSVADLDVLNLMYQPRTEQTRLVHGLIIKFVKKILGFQHNSVINGAADDVIKTMKDPNSTEETRRYDVNNILQSNQELSDEDYNELCNLCKKINDYDPDQGKSDKNEDEVGAVGLVDSDEDSSDEYASEIRDSEEEPDLDDMFEKHQEVDLTTPFAPMEIQDDDVANSKYKTLNLNDLSRRQTNIGARIDFGEPILKEGYKEYHIQPKRRQSSRDDYLIKIEDLPELEQKAFPEIKSLNVIQSKIYERAMKSDRSLLICAPTGAGKTNIAILTMLREVLKYKREDGSGFDVDQFKIIYIAPIKALVQEIVQNFTKRLGCAPYNLRVDELTGDHQLDQKQISRSQIIVCTPEKWDIVTRKSLDRLYTKIVRLVIFDEIHLLHNERGATLEALVSRIKRHMQLEGQPIRIIGLSATLPNYKDVARFIAPDDSLKTSSIYFDGSYRPIPLRQQYIALTESKKAFRMTNDIVYDKVIERLAEQSQILVFVHSRPDTAKTGEFIKCRALEEHKLSLFLSSESAVEKINDYGRHIGSKLKELLQFGIGIHHAGLSRTERSCVEDLFKGKYIKVLVSTATLAWGVNLPARTVIIKGTQVYRDGKWTDLDSLDLTQMLGRAGRPGFDKEGEGIVITQQSQVQFYMSLMSEQLPVESKLIGRLPEFINAECVCGNVESLDDAVNWLSETYLNARMTSLLEQENSSQYLSMYGIDSDSRYTDPKLVMHKHNLAYTALSSLDDKGLVNFDRISGVVRSTDLGRIASNFNCSSRTIKLFHDSIHEHTSDIELFRIFSLADEFKDIYVRKGEEIDLQALLNQVPFPIDDKRATPGANKVNALLQVYIFRMNIEGSDLISDMHFIRDSAARLARAIHEIVLMKGYAAVSELSFDLCRKIDKRMTVCHTPLRQFSNDLDLDLVNRLERKNYHIDELRALKADKITELLRCHRSQGEKIYRYLKYLPKLRIEASVKPISNKSLRIDLTIEPDFTWSEKHHGYSERFWVLVQDVNKEVLLHYEVVYMRKNNPSDSIQTTFYVPYLMPAHPFYFIKVLPDNWFGCDHNVPIYLENLCLPEESYISIQTLTIDPQRIASLNNKLFERIYEEKYRGAGFNQMQSQSFDTIYNTNHDIILMAPAGSGKTTCAELAVIRNINLQGTASKCAFIAANTQSAKLVYSDWLRLFGRHYGLVLLTGNYRADAPKVDRQDSNIVIGDPETWHILTLTKSKKYRKNKLLDQFQLFIIDDLHLLYNDNNSIFEWLCSKIRIVTKLKKEPPRLMAMGSPVACVDSFKSWLAYERASKEPKLLNHPMSMRCVRLELMVHKFHHHDFGMRLLTMQRPVYRLITQLSVDKPTLLFVSDYNRAMDVCDVLINYAKSEGIGFVRSKPKIERSHDHYLKDFLSRGVGYIHMGMDDEDKELVESMFERGQIRVLVVTISMVWSTRARSYLTIIMDTQHHDGLDSREYELTDIMQMVGLTGRPLNDHECKCILMCHASKADYYERFLEEPLTIESNLPSSLITHVNFEVATGSISELNNIYKPYLAHTLFYKRISINPNYYGILPPDNLEEKPQVFGSFFNDLVNKVSLDLEKSDFISMEGSHENPKFQAALLSKISLEFYINFETLNNYNKWLMSNPNMIDLKQLELIELISTNTLEFSNIQVRHGELQDLKYLQRRHRPREGDQLHSPSFKVKLLILSQYQKTDGREDPVDGELISDRHYIISTSYRVLMALVEIAWIKDSFILAKTAIQLAKKLHPFNRASKPNIDMVTNITRENDTVKISVEVSREDDPFSLEEFNTDYRLPGKLYRDEGWYFLVLGSPRVESDPEKFVVFNRVKTPARGLNDYNLVVELPDNSEAYSYDLYMMSDFYSTREDRKVPDMSFKL